MYGAAPTLDSDVRDFSALVANNYCIMGGSPGELSEELVMWEKRKKGWRMSCDVGKVTERLENEQSS